MIKKALIVGASNYSIKYIKKIIKDYDYVIACDKGAEAFYNEDIKFDLCIGDFDSCNPNIYESFKNENLITFPIEKDFSDLELAINEIRKKDFKRIDFTGVLGGRLSHELTNLNVLLKLKEDGYKVGIREAMTRCEYVNGGEILKIPKGLEVSVIPMYNDGSILTLNGFKWDLNRKHIQRGSSLTLSNLTVDEALLRVEGKTALVVIEPTEKKTR